MQPPAPSTSAAAPELPRDGAAINKLLRSMGVEEFEPAVTQQLLQFMYGYTSEILGDAADHAENAGRPPGSVDLDSVMLAIQSRTTHAFVQPPNQDMMAALADEINRQPLPPITKQHGLRLPPESESLVAPNYQLDPLYLQPHQRHAQQ